MQIWLSYDWEYLIWIDEINITDTETDKQLSVYPINNYWLSELLIYLTNDSYDKYWENYYALKWKGHKEPDLVRLLYEYQEREYSKQELLAYISEEWLENLL